MSVEAETPGSATKAALSTASTGPELLYDTEYQALEQLKTTLISMETAPEDFRKNVALIQSNPKENTLTEDDTTELDPTTMADADPTQIDGAITHQHEQFKNLKLAYLEQETKEKFVRAVVWDPPLVVEASDMTEVETSNRAKKQQLRALKTACAEMEEETVVRARDVVAEHASLQHDAAEVMDLIMELRAMEREVAELETKRQQKQRELESDIDDGTLTDLELTLPYEEMRQLVETYTQQARELETMTRVPLAAKAEAKARELQSLTRGVTDLRQQRARAETAAQESAAARERELARGLGEKEAVAQWHRNMLAVLEHTLGISGFVVEPFPPHQTTLPGLPTGEKGGAAMTTTLKQKNLLKLSYAVATTDVEVFIDEDTGRVVSATVRDPNLRVTPANVERMVADSRNAEPSRFLIQLFSHLQ
ncbi:hypothetical protein D0Z00_003229 [Geotrichum galactomycetum]|uniref:Uncharacterized protein n=1 Tax=Geotrichum galactomycetum TaxID=27317 RepID=A0ACB6V1Y8_9ASCO|nr:hypothetical protein D0Z00_003229 [Geotrichum candidum]